MKRIFTWIAGCCFSLGAVAQTVSITVNGNRNQQVIVNNKTYDIQNNTNNLSKTITLTSLRPGQYSLELVRINDYNVNDDDISTSDNSIPKVRSTTTFTVKDGFDIAIIVAPNGIVQVKEKQVIGTTSDPRIVMPDAAFATLLTDIQFHWRNTRKITAAQTALSNNNNYFTTAQVMQILESVEGDVNRLALAKHAYNRLIDPSNFVQVYSLMPTPATREELAVFIRSHTGSTAIFSYSETYRQAITDMTFDALLQKIRRDMDPSTRINAVTEVIANQTNYFTVSQVRRLIELVEFESARVHLLRDVFTHVVDTENFPLLYSLLTTDGAKIELINYIKNAAENGGLVNYNLNKPAMNEDEFAKLLNTAREHFTAGTGVAFLSNEFADITNYFTARQAIQLISLAEGELSRMSLAKTIYRGITDPADFLLLMNNVLTLAVTKNELNIYAYSYRPL